MFCLDRLELEGNLSEDLFYKRQKGDLFYKRQKLSIDLDDILFKEETSRRQMMKFQWAKEGDVDEVIS